MCGEAISGISKQGVVPMKKLLMICVILFTFIITGCQNNDKWYLNEIDYTEPTETYNWMAGESPVSANRMGLIRAGVNHADYTIAPNGVYFMYNTGSSTMSGMFISYVMYSDYGSDTVIKLCGRADCDHSDADCNAYFENGCNICYHNGYLYATNSNGIEYDCVLYRLDVDGNNRVVLFDFTKFAKEQGTDFAMCDMIDNGICYVTTYKWVEMENEDGLKSLQGEAVSTYLYKVDGSTKEPKLMEAECGPLYHCGNVFLALMNGTQNGGFNGYDFSYGDWDADTDTVTYLTDHPGIAGYYGEEEGYYFRNGAVCRLTYESKIEERIIETGLEGNYYAKCFPDCLVLASKETGADADKRLYVYNWNYELVETIDLSFLTGSVSAHQALMIETAERFILTNDSMSWIPRYYIEKDELGSGNVKIHTFSLPDFQ